MVTFDKTRRDWGAKPPRRFRNPPRRYTRLEVHHTASPTQAALQKRSPERVMFLIQAGHLRKGWNDIFYNGFVMPDGTVYEGRADTPNGAFRLCFLGNFEVEPVTPEQAAVLRKWDRLFEGETDTHTWRAAGTKYASACPGDNMIALVTEVLNNSNEGVPMTREQNFQTVDRMYRNILGHEPDAPGRNFWTGQLDNGLDFAVLLFEFLSVRLAGDAAAARAVQASLDSRNDLGLSAEAVARAAREAIAAELAEVARLFGRKAG